MCRGKVDRSQGGAGGGENYSITSCWNNSCRAVLDRHRSIYLSYIYSISASANDHVFIQIIYKWADCTVATVSYKLAHDDSYDIIRFRAYFPSFLWKQADWTSGLNMYRTERVI